MSTRKKFKWILEIEVDELWVEDGFNMQPGWVAKIAEFIPWASEDEVKVKVLSAPDPKEIRKVQGYE